MKRRILLLMMTALLSVGAWAENVFNTPTEMNWGIQIITPSVKLKVGDLIVVTATIPSDYNAQGYLKKRNSDWSETELATVISYPGAGEDQHFFVQVTQSIVDAIDDAEGHGIGITGVNFTLTSVDVTHGNANIYTNADGRAQDSWQGEQLSKELFALANVGDVLAINVSTAGDYQTAKIYNLTPSSVWNGSGFDDPDGLKELAAQQFSGAGKVCFQLTEAILTAAQSGGLCIGGGKYTYTSVDLYYAPTSRSVTIGSTGYATFGYPFAVDLSRLGEDQDAYTVTVSGDKALLTSVKDKKIPAGTGIILKGTDGDAISLPLTTALTDAIGTNNLHVSDGNVTGDESTIYALANKDVVGFYLVDTGVTVPAGKAYLLISGDVALARAFIGFGDDNGTTGIDEVRSNTEEVRSDYFDLQGRRVAQPTKGLYIVNGKKVIIK